MAHRPAPLRIVVCVCASALVLLSGCPGSSGDDVGDESATDTDTGDEQGCADPGSALLEDDVKPVGAASQTGDPQYTCVSGWGSDAPVHQATWSVRLPDNFIQNEGQFQSSLLVEAHPNSGVILYGPGELFYVDGDGQEGWSIDVGSDESQINVAVEDAGTVLVAVYNWNNEDFSFTRYGADGAEIGAVPVPWNAPLDASIWAIETLGSDIILGAYDQDGEGNFEETLLRLDADGNEVLRRSTNLFSAVGLTVSASGVAAFGRSPAFMVSLDNGAVLGQLQPSAGNAVELVGGEDQFYAATAVAGDFGVSAYSEFGTEQWLNQYDRATLNDRPRRIDARDGVVAAVGDTGMLNLAQSYWYTNQPMVMATDVDGEVLWTDRIDAHGEMSDVSIGSDGAVYVTGLAELDGPTNTETGNVRWLSKYDAF